MPLFLGFLSPIWIPKIFAFSSVVESGFLLSSPSGNVVLFYFTFVFYQISSLIVRAFSGSTRFYVSLVLVNLVCLAYYFILAGFRLLDQFFYYSRSILLLLLSQWKEVDDSWGFSFGRSITDVCGYISTTFTDIFNPEGFSFILGKSAFTYQSFMLILSIWKVLRILNPWYYI